MYFVSAKWCQLAQMLRPHRRRCGLKVTLNSSDTFKPSTSHAVFLSGCSGAGKPPAAAQRLSVLRGLPVGGGEPEDLPAEPGGSQAGSGTQQGSVSLSTTLDPSCEPGRSGNRLVPLPPSAPTSCRLSEVRRVEAQGAGGVSVSTVAAVLRCQVWC